MPCTHASVTTPFCPFCGERMEDADLMELRRHIENQMKTRTVPKNRDKWRRWLEAIDKLSAKAGD